MKRSILKFISGVLILLFLMNDIGRAAPSLDLSSPFTGDRIRLDSLLIPSKFGSIDDWQQSSNPVQRKVVLHIQDAHTNASAQENIKNLIEYFQTQYGFKTVLVEGAAEELDSKWLGRQNDESIRENLAAGKLSGADLYLLAHPKQIRALPLEEIPAYQRNYQALIHVYSNEELVSGFLDLIDKKLAQKSTQVFAPEALSLIKEWEKFQAGHREFLPYVNDLSRLAKNNLNIDFDSLDAQLAWPQITRLLVLQKIEKKLQGDYQRRAAEERAAVLDGLKRHNAPRALIQGFENLSDDFANAGKIQAGAKVYTPREFFELWIHFEQGKGFDFQAHRAFLEWAGKVILQSELKPSILFSEIERLFDSLLSKSGAPGSPAEKIVGIYRDKTLLAKLLRLELSRDDWQALSDRKDLIKPGLLLERLASQSVNHKSRDPLQTVEDIFNRAIDFYEAAVARESVFESKLEAALNENDKVILITGGFHAEGMKAYFRGQNVSFGTLVPRIDDLGSSELYREVMLSESETFAKATLASIDAAQSPVIRAEMRANPGRPAPSRGAEVSDAVIRDGLSGVFRSELRKIDLSEVIAHSLPSNLAAHMAEYLKGELVRDGEPLLPSVSIRNLNLHQTLVEMGWKQQSELPEKIESIVFEDRQPFALKINGRGGAVVQVVLFSESGSIETNKKAYQQMQASNPNSVARILKNVKEKLLNNQAVILDVPYSLETKKDKRAFLSALDMLAQASERMLSREEAENLTVADSAKASQGVGQADQRIKTIDDEYSSLIENGAARLKQIAELSFEVPASLDTAVKQTAELKKLKEEAEKLESDLNKFRTSRLEQIRHIEKSPEKNALIARLNKSPADISEAVKKAKENIANRFVSMAATLPGFLQADFKLYAPEDQTSISFWEAQQVNFDFDLNLPEQRAAAEKLIADFNNLSELKKKISKHVGDYFGIYLRWWGEFLVPVSQQTYRELAKIQDEQNAAVKKRFEAIDQRHKDNVSRLKDTIRVFDAEAAAKRQQAEEKVQADAREAAQNAARKKTLLTYWGVRLGGLAIAAIFASLLYPLLFPPKPALMAPQTVSHQNRGTADAPIAKYVQYFRTPPLMDSNGFVRLDTPTYAFTSIKISLDFKAAGKFYFVEFLGDSSYHNENLVANLPPVPFNREVVMDVPPGATHIRVTLSDKPTRTTSQGGTFDLPKTAPGVAPALGLGEFSVDSIEFIPAPGYFPRLDINGRTHWKPQVTFSSGIPVAWNQVKKIQIRFPNGYSGSIVMAGHGENRSGQKILVNFSHSADGSAGSFTSSFYLNSGDLVVYPQGVESILGPVDFEFIVPSQNVNPHVQVITDQGEAEVQLMALDVDPNMVRIGRQITYAIKMNQTMNEIPSPRPMLYTSLVTEMEDAIAEQDGVRVPLDIESYQSIGFEKSTASVDPNFAVVIIKRRDGTAIIFGRDTSSQVNGKGKLYRLLYPGARQVDVSPDGLIFRMPDAAVQSHGWNTVRAWLDAYLEKEKRGEVRAEVRLIPSDWALGAVGAIVPAALAHYFVFAGGPFIMTLAVMCTYLLMTWFFANLISEIATSPGDDFQREKRKVNKLYNKIAKRVVRELGVSDDVLDWLLDSERLKLYPGQFSPFFSSVDAAIHIPLGHGKAYQEKPRLLAMCLAHEIAHAVHYRFNADSIGSFSQAPLSEAFAASVAYTLFPDIARSEWVRTEHKELGSEAMVAFLNDADAQTSYEAELSAALVEAREKFLQHPEQLLEMGYTADYLERLRQSEDTDALMADLPYAYIAESDDEVGLKMVSVSIRNKIFTHNFWLWLGLQESYSSNPEIVNMAAALAEDEYVHADGFLLMRQILREHPNYDETLPPQTADWRRIVARTWDVIRVDPEQQEQAADQFQAELMKSALPSAANTQTSRNDPWPVLIIELMEERFSGVVELFSRFVFNFSTRFPDFNLLDPSRLSGLHDEAGLAFVDDSEQFRVSEQLTSLLETTPLWKASQLFLVNHLRTDFWPFKDLDGDTVKAVWESVSDWIERFNADKLRGLRLELSDEAGLMNPVLFVNLKSDQQDAPPRLVIKNPRTVFVHRSVLVIQVNSEDEYGLVKQVYRIPDESRAGKLVYKLRSQRNWSWDRALSFLVRGFRYLTVISLILVVWFEVYDRWKASKAPLDVQPPKAIPVFEAKPVHPRSEVRAATSRRNFLFGTGFMLFGAAFVRAEDEPQSVRGVPDYTAFASHSRPTQQQVVARYQEQLSAGNKWIMHDQKDWTAAVESALAEAHPFMFRLRSKLALEQLTHLWGVKEDKIVANMHDMMLLLSVPESLSFKWLMQRNSMNEMIYVAQGNGVETGFHSSHRAQDDLDWLTSPVWKSKMREGGSLRKMWDRLREIASLKLGLGGDPNQLDVWMADWSDLAKQQAEKLLAPVDNPENPEELVYPFTSWFEKSEIRDDLSDQIKRAWDDWNDALGSQDEKDKKEALITKKRRVLVSAIQAVIRNDMLGAYLSKLLVGDSDVDVLFGLSQLVRQGFFYAHERRVAASRVFSEYTDAKKAVTTIEKKKGVSQADINKAKNALIAAEAEWDQIPAEFKLRDGLNYLRDSDFEAFMRDRYADNLTPTIVYGYDYRRRDLDQKKRGLVSALQDLDPNPTMKANDRIMNRASDMFKVDYRGLLLGVRPEDSPHRPYFHLMPILDDSLQREILAAQFRMVEKMNQNRVAVKALPRAIPVPQLEPSAELNADIKEQDDAYSLAQAELVRLNQVLEEMNKANSPKISFPTLTIFSALFGFLSFLNKLSFKQVRHRSQTTGGAIQVTKHGQSLALRIRYAVIATSFSAIVFTVLWIASVVGWGISQGVSFADILRNVPMWPLAVSFTASILGFAAGRYMPQRKPSGAQPAKRAEMRTRRHFLTQTLWGAGVLSGLVPTQSNAQSTISGEWKLAPPSDYNGPNRRTMQFRTQNVRELQFVFDTRLGHAPQAFSLNANGAFRGHSIRKARNDGMASTFYLLRYHDKNGRLHDNALVDEVTSARASGNRLLIDLVMKDGDAADGYKPFRVRLTVHAPDTVDGTLRMDFEPLEPLVFYEGAGISKEKIGLTEGLLFPLAATNHSGREPSMGGNPYFDAKRIQYHGSSGETLFASDLTAKLSEVPQSGFRFLTASGDDWKPKVYGEIAAMSIVNDQLSPAHAFAGMTTPPSLLIVPQTGSYTAFGVITKDAKTNHQSDNVNAGLQPESLDDSRGIQLPAISVFFMPGDNFETIKRIPELIRSVRRSELRQVYEQNAQPYFDYLAQGDEIGWENESIDPAKLPQVFLLLGNPDLKTFVEFARLFKRLPEEKQRETYIILAGGIGRGTLPLLKAIIAQYGENAVLKGFSLKDQSARLEAYLAQPEEGKAPFYESDLMEFILLQEGIQPQIQGEYAFLREEKPSKNTNANFENALEVFENIYSASGDNVNDIGLVTAPWLLKRVLLTGYNVFAENGKKSISLKRVQAYQPIAAEMPDVELLALGEYVHGDKPLWSEEESGITLTEGEQNSIDHDPAKSELKGIVQQHRKLLALNAEIVLPADLNYSEGNAHQLTAARRAYQNWLLSRVIRSEAQLDSGFGSRFVSWLSDARESVVPVLVLLSVLALISYVVYWVSGPSAEDLAWRASNQKAALSHLSSMDPSALGLFRQKLLDRVDGGSRSGANKNREEKDQFAFDVTALLGVEVERAHLLMAASRSSIVTDLEKLNRPIQGRDDFTTAWKKLQALSGTLQKFKDQLNHVKQRQKELDDLIGLFGYRDIYGLTRNWRDQYDDWVKHLDLWQNDLALLREKMRAQASEKLAQANPRMKELFQSHQLRIQFKQKLDESILSANKLHNSLASLLNNAEGVAVTQHVSEGLADLMSADNEHLEEDVRSANKLYQEKIRLLSDPTYAGLYPGLTASTRNVSNPETDGIIGRWLLGETAEFFGVDSVSVRWLSRLSDASQVRTHMQDVKAIVDHLNALRQKVSIANDAADAEFDNSINSGLNLNDAEKRSEMRGMTRREMLTATLAAVMTWNPGLSAGDLNGMFQPAVWNPRNKEKVKRALELLKRFSAVAGTEDVSQLRADKSALGSLVREFNLKVAEFNGLVRRYNANNNAVSAAELARRESELNSLKKDLAAEQSSQGDSLERKVSAHLEVYNQLRNLLGLKPAVSAVNDDSYGENFKIFIRDQLEPWFLSMGVVVKIAGYSALKVEYGKKRFEIISPEKVSHPLVITSVRPSVQVKSLTVPSMLISIDATLKEFGAGTDSEATHSNNGFTYGDIAVLIEERIRMTVKQQMEAMGFEGAKGWFKLLSGQRPDFSGDAETQSQSKARYDLIEIQLRNQGVTLRSVAGKSDDAVIKDVREAMIRAQYKLTAWHEAYHVWRASPGNEKWALLYKLNRSQLSPAAQELLEGLIEEDVRLLTLETHPAEFLLEILSGDFEKPGRLGEMPRARAAREAMLRISSAIQYVIRQSPKAYGNSLEAAVVNISSDLNLSKKFAAAIRSQLQTQERAEKLLGQLHRSEARYENLLDSAGIVNPQSQLTRPSGNSLGLQPSQPLRDVNVESAYLRLIGQIDSLGEDLAVDVVAHMIVDDRLDIDHKKAALMLLVSAMGQSKPEAIRAKIQAKIGIEKWNGLVRQFSNRGTFYRLISQADWSDSDMRKSIIDAMKAVWILSPNQNFQLMVEGKLNDSDVEAVRRDIFDWAKPLGLNVQFGIRSAVNREALLRSLPHSGIRAALSGFNIPEGMEDRMHMVVVNESWNRSMDAGRKHAAVMFEMAFLSQMAAQSNGLLENAPDFFSAQGNRFRIDDRSFSSLNAILTDLQAIIEIAIAA